MQHITDGDSPGADVLSDGQAIYTPGLSERRGNVSYAYTLDALGHLRGRSGSGGAANAKLTSDAFGQTVSQSGSSPLPFGFEADAQYQTDNDSGLTLVGNRYYDPAIGRFTQPDPSGQEDNEYAYANNPLRNNDPEGLVTAPRVTGQQTNSFHDNGSGRGCFGGRGGFGGRGAKRQNGMGRPRRYPKPANPNLRKAINIIGRVAKKNPRWKKAAADLEDMISNGWIRFDGDLGSQGATGATSITGIITIGSEFAGELSAEDLMMLVATLVHEWQHTQQNYFYKGYYHHESEVEAFNTEIDFLKDWLSMTTDSGKREDLENLIKEITGDIPFGS